jgi:hypothetical protein
VCQVKAIVKHVLRLTYSLQLEAALLTNEGVLGQYTKGFLAPEVQRDKEFIDGDPLSLFVSLTVSLCLILTASVCHSLCLCDSLPFCDSLCLCHCLSHSYYLCL